MQNNFLNVANIVQDSIPPLNLKVRISLENKLKIQINIYDKLKKNYNTQKVPNFIQIFLLLYLFQKTKVLIKYLKHKLIVKVYKQFIRRISQCNIYTNTISFLIRFSFPNHSCSVFDFRNNFTEAKAIFYYLDIIQLRDKLRHNNQEKILNKKGVKFNIIRKNQLILFVLKLKFQIKDHRKSESDSKLEELISFLIFRTQKNLACNNLNQIIELLERMPFSQQILKKHFQIRNQLVCLKYLFQHKSFLFQLSTKRKFIFQYSFYQDFQPIFQLLNDFKLHQDYFIILKDVYIKNHEGEYEIDNYLKLTM